MFGPKDGYSQQIGGAGWPGRPSSRRVCLLSTREYFDGSRLPAAPDVMVVVQGVIHGEECNAPLVYGTACDWQPLYEKRAASGPRKHISRSPDVQATIEHKFLKRCHPLLLEWYHRERELYSETVLLKALGEFCAHELDPSVIYKAKGIAAPSKATSRRDDSSIGSDKSSVSAARRRPSASEHRRKGSAVSVTNDRWVTPDSRKTQVQRVQSDTAVTAASQSATPAPTAPAATPATTPSPAPVVAPAVVAPAPPAPGDVKELQLSCSNADGTKSERTVYRVYVGASDKVEVSYITDILTADECEQLLKFVTKAYDKWENGTVSCCGLSRYPPTGALEAVVLKSALEPTKELVNFVPEAVRATTARYLGNLIKLFSNCLGVPEANCVSMCIEKMSARVPYTWAVHGSDNTSEFIHTFCAISPVPETGESDLHLDVPNHTLAFPQGTALLQYGRGALVQKLASPAGLSTDLVVLRFSFFK